MTQNLAREPDSASAPPRPGPELTPLKYWPAQRPSDADLGLFITRRDDLRRVAGMQAALAVWLGVVSLVLRDLFVLSVTAFAAASAAAFYVGARRMDVPPSGVWRVDAQGYPVSHVAAKPPPHLRRDRGLTRSAFVESVALRAAER